jgi:deoxyribose-phosphate aldolase
MNGMMLHFLGDDTEVNVLRLCHKALNPLRKDIVDKLDLDFGPVTCGAVCVYPARVLDAATTLKNAGSNLPVASGKELRKVKKMSKSILNYFYQ